MATWHLAWAFLGLAVTTVQTPMGGQGAPETIPVKPTPLESVEQLPVPPDAIIVISDDLTKALDAMRPGMIVLSAERYRELMEQARKGKGEPGPVKDTVPISVCRFTGEVQRDALGKQVLFLRAALEFRTETPDAMVPIGFRGIRLTKAALDGEPPIWAADGDGLAVRVKTAKNHQLHLEMQLPVVPSGASRRVAIERVPSAAVTSLDLTMPEPVRSGSVKGAGPVTIQPLDGQGRRLVSEALGVLRELELTWQPDVPASATPLQITALGDVRIHLGQAVVQTEARLRVEVRQGSAGALKFRLGADVAPVDVTQLDSADDSLGTPLEWSFNKQEGVLTAALKGPRSAADGPLLLRLRWQQAFSGKPGSTPLVTPDLIEPPGPTHTGTIGIWTAPGVHAQFQHNLLAISPQDLPGADQRGAAHAFRYWRQPIQLEAKLGSSPAIAPSLETRVQHTLKLVAQTLALSSEFEILPRPGAGVQELEIRWPKGFSVDRRLVLTNLVESLDVGETSLRIHLSGRQQERFAFKLEGVMPLPSDPLVALELPAILQATSERGGRKEAAQVIFRSGELLLSATDAEVWLQEGTTGLRLEDRRLPDHDVPLRGPMSFVLEPPGPERDWRLALAWQPKRHELRGSAAAFVTNSEVQVQQSMRCQFAGLPPGQIWLRIPRTVERLLQVRLTYQTPNGDAREAAGLLFDRPRQSDARMVERALAVPGDVGRELEMRFDFRVERSALMGGTTLSVPLVTPSPGELLDHGGDVHCWVGAGLKLGLRAEEAAWKPATLPRLAEFPVLPALQLRSSSPDSPLELSCVAAETALPDLAADRVLFEVTPVSDNQFDYRASFWLSRVRTDHLEVRLPGRPGDLTLRRVVLDQREYAVDSLELAPQPNGEPQMILRIPCVPRFLGREILLELEFRLQSDMPGWLGFSARLPAPELSGAVVIGRTRWRVEWPADRLALSYAGEELAEQGWSWAGWLRAPRSSRLAGEMRSWLTGAAVRPPAHERLALGYTQVAGIALLDVASIPRQAWLLGCSLSVLLVGMGLFIHGRRRPGLCLTVVALGLLAGGFWSPALLVAFLYGAQPGIVVLTMCVVLLGLWRRRWRRQVAVMPGFSQRAAGSSLLRSTTLRSSAREAAPADVPKEVSPISAEPPA